MVNQPLNLYKDFSAFHVMINLTSIWLAHKGQALLSHNH